VALVGLADSNSFFASCEKVFRPDLKNSPVVVLSNNDGCIVALTQEVKDLGIQRGTPYFKVEKLLKKSGCAVFSSNYTLYQDISRRIFEVLGIFVEDIDLYSIDEAFFSFPEYLNEAEVSSYINKLHNTLYRRTGMKVSIGIGRTKTLAKIANHIAKKNNGAFYLSKEKEAKIIKNLPVKEVWGIGYRNASKLESFKIYTAGEFMERDDKWIRKHFSITGVRTVSELRGIPCITEDDYRIRSFASGISFQKPVTSFEELLESLSCHCGVVSSKLISKKIKAGTVGVQINSNRFHDNYYSSFYYVKLVQSSCYVPTFIKACRTCLEHIYKNNVEYKSSRVFVSDFSFSQDRQFSLFDEPNYSKVLKKRDQMALCVQELEITKGKNVIHPAITYSKRKHDLSSRNYLSPCYTTRWKDIAKVY